MPEQAAERRAPTRRVSNRSKHPPADLEIGAPLVQGRRSRKNKVGVVGSLVVTRASLPPGL